MERDKPRNLIVQPKIDFGELPATIQGVSADDQEVIRHIRANKGLAELRFFVFKSKSDFKTVPCKKAPLSRILATPWARVAIATLMLVLSEECRV